MFHTSDNAKICLPPELQQPGITSWQNVWHDTHIAWLQISFVIKRQNVEITNRILMTSSVQDLETLSENSNVNLVEVNLISPGSDNKTGRWTLAPLRSIWIKKSEACCYAYMLNNGNLISELPFNEAKLSEYTMIWEWDQE